MAAKGRRLDRDGNVVPYLGMQGLSEEAGSALYRESFGRRILLGPVRAHNLHLKSGLKTRESCGVCTEGMEGILEAMPPVQKPTPEPGVDKSDGSDEGGDPPLAPNSRAVDAWSKVLEGG